MIVNAPTAKAVTPQTINIHRKSAILELGYADGSSHRLTAEFLRVHSPSAEVKGHGPGQAVLQDGKQDVQFLDVEPQGNYAIRIIFSDGHDSGIYSWDYLHQLATRKDELWQAYLARLARLAEAGKRRQAQFIAAKT